MKRCIYIVFFLISVISCEEYIEVDPPLNLSDKNIVFSSDVTASSAMSGMYANMMRTNFYISYFIPYYTGLYSDELDYRQSAALISGHYKYSLNSKDAPSNLFWNNAYNIIYQANSIIEGVEEASGVSNELKAQLLGEAVFMRAFFHYYLTNFYGEVPIITSTNYLENASKRKAPKSEVYAQIETDFKTSKSLLTKKYVGADSKSEVSQRLRPNMYAASAMLIRYYLGLKMWDKVIEEASFIEASSIYNLENTDLVFKKVSKEVILQFDLPTATASVNNSFEAAYFTLKAKPSALSHQRSATVTATLLSLFSTEDLRRTKWIGAFKDASGTYYFPSKYKSLTSSNIDEASTVLRFAEVLLSRAEAYANSDQLLLAIDDLDKIRVRSGLLSIKSTNPTISKDQLLKLISDERRRELFCEWGARWVDIKRSSDFSTTMIQLANNKGVIWNDDMSVWPIPLNDVLNNKNLIQNDGYN